MAPVRGAVIGAQLENNDGRFVSERPGQARPSTSRRITRSPALMKLTL